MYLPRTEMTQRNIPFRFVLRQLTLLLTLGALAFPAIGQLDSTLHKKLWIAGGVAYGGSMVALNQLWYDQFERSSFHTFNDNAQWLQMDKAGHAMTAYHINDAAHRALVGVGSGRRRAAWYGAGVSLLCLTSIEVLDGFSTAWGFSWGDQLANTAGVGLFLGQEMLWQEQRIRLKYSYLPSSYADQNPALLGRDWTERWLKDYNAQTYWLSVNPGAFAGENTRWPSWLNVAAGYGADGMVTGRGEVVDPLSSFHQVRTRQYFLSMDVDLTQIPTSKRWLRILLDAAGFIKLPFPGLQYDSVNGLRGCAICG